MSRPSTRKDDPGRRLGWIPGYHAQQRALPGTTRPEHAQHLAAGQLEVRPRQGRCHVPLIRAMHAEHVAQLHHRFAQRTTLPRGTSHPASVRTANVPTLQAASAAHGTTVTTGGLGSATAPAPRTLATASRVSSTAIPRPTITPSRLASASRSAQLGPESARTDALFLRGLSSTRSSRAPPSSAASSPTTASSTDSAVAAIQRSAASTPRRNRRVPELMIDVSAERGVKLGERYAPQRGAQTREVPGSDP